MKRLGIIGGTGPESTIDYYRSIVGLYRERQPDGTYEVVDTKLARHSKPAYVLQLCFYSEQVARNQGSMPKRKLSHTNGAPAKSW